MKNPLVQLAVYGVAGSLLGILTGFVLSFVIRGLLMLVAGQELAGDAEFAPVVHMLSMGFGAVIGGVFGGIAGLKK